MNKKLLATLVTSSFLVSALATNAGAASDKQVLKDETGAVHNVVGKLGQVTGNTAEERALHALEKAKHDFGFAKANGNFQVKASHQDEMGTSHTKMNQVIGDIPVYASQMIVHEKNGDVLGITGSYQNLTIDAATASITEKTAIQTATSGDTPDATPQVDLVYFPQGDQALLAYKVAYTTTLTDTPARFEVFVSAVDGTVIQKFNRLETGTAAVGYGKGALGDTKSLNTELTSGTYYLHDLTKPMYTGTAGWIRTRDMKNGTSVIYEMTDADNVWNTLYQAPGVDAHFHAGKIYDWYKNVAGRNSIKGTGDSIESLVHYSKNYNNAFWNGTYMVYGDGDGVTFRPLSAALDIGAHEMTHGVIEYTAALIYSGQSGALNESWADSLACAIEGKNWTIGEDAYTPATSGDALRSLSSPSTYGDPEHMSQYINTTEDNGGVHTNSGIPNKAFYYFATTIGSRDIAGKVWYVAARDYMTSTTTFSGARAATLQAATALYGADSAIVSALKQAWDRVGVY